MTLLASDADLNVRLQREVDTAAALDALAAASGAVRAVCGWSISEEQNVVATVTGDGYYVWLPTLKLTAISSVVEDGVTLAASDYWFQVNGAVIRRNRRWSREPFGIAITYTHGYDPVPAAAKSVCLSAAVRVVANPRGLRSWALGDESESYAGSGVSTEAVIADGEMAQLQSLRLPLLA